MTMDKTARAIANLRKNAGFTQASLAERLGVSDKAVSKWERGISYPDVTLWNKLSILLDTDIENLLYGQERESSWKGVWIMDENVNPFTMVYNKPLYHYVLSQFLLVGINHIYIVGECGEMNIPGVQLEKVSNLNEVNHRLRGPVFAIIGNSFLYGPNLTKHFTRAMSRDGGVTIIATMKAKGLYPINVDSERIASLSDSISMNQYFAEPFVFYGENTEIELRKSMDELLKQKNVNVETMVRGMLSFHLEDHDDLFDLSGFIKLMENQTGEKIACLEEIAIRRGLIEE